MKTWQSWEGKVFEVTAGELQIQGHHPLASLPPAQGIWVALQHLFSLSPIIFLSPSPFLGDQAFLYGML